MRKPPRMVLTARDREILRQVYEFRVMTREQIEQLLFPPQAGQTHLTKTSRVRQRLKLLYQHGYLERIPTPVAPGAWAWRPVYRLGRQGVALVAAELATPAAQLSYWGRGADKDRRKTPASVLFLQHTLQINAVHIALLHAAHAHHYQIEKWQDDAQLKSQEIKDYVTVQSARGDEGRVCVVPDAYFILHLGTRRAHFFVEVDRATLTNRRWRTRVLAYQEYIDSGRYAERYQTRSLLRILTITTTPQRLANLRQTTARAGGQDKFWFTTFEQIQTQDILAAPIWLLAHDEHASARKALVE